MGVIFQPLSWTMGIPWDEAKIVGSLMGEKIVLTELVAYSNLSDLVNNNLISNRSAIIASYALCGFANFGSIGIQCPPIPIPGFKYFTLGCILVILKSSEELVL